MINETGLVSLKLVRTQAKKELYMSTSRVLLLAASITAAFVCFSGLAAASEKKPNILIITSDDTGIWDISFNNRGSRGFNTPNIDRIAEEGMAFTDYYGDQSCTAGRSTLITGQTTLRTGLAKVGLPGSKNGMRAEDPTIATALKSMGYATAQFGKNHLGDRDEHLPTMHGFDEFFGILYHLNAFNELENVDYPKDPELSKKFAPRNPLRTAALPNGKQEIEDTGPLTSERMKTFDDEVLELGLGFIGRQHRAGKPFFLWMNSTRMHYPTYLPDEWDGASGRGLYADGMLQHDAWVGAILNHLDELGIAENTIVIYNADNGPQSSLWPDGGVTPYRSEKFTSWEGAYRVPGAVRWPERIPKGSVSNEIMSNLDWFPTLLAAAGDPDIKGKLLKGYELNGKKYRVHLDGYNQLPLLTGQSNKGARNEFFYFTDSGDLSALRFGDWKLIFAEQRGKGLGAWQEPFVVLNFPKLFNLRTDPFERAALNSNSYDQWAFDRTFVGSVAKPVVVDYFMSFKEFPPQQRPVSFNPDVILQKIQSGNNN
jgi:arylsulfatase A-like enzyme